jgi:glycosyltransferase involved in cell wall biosynthesis
MNSINSPLVTILCVTYNHKKFLSQAIDSFLMQKTNFPFEIIIHDDASTDGTPEIIRKYAKANPIILPLYEKNNQYSSGNDAFIMDMFRMAKGKYIAECEGDDYWTDPHKIQKQVDVLEKNLNHALCFHPVKVISEGDSSDSYRIYPDPGSNIDFNLENLLKVNFIQSNSVMYRKQKYKNMPKGILPLDWYTHLYHAQFGRIGFIDQAMSVYRRHQGGLWSHENPDKVWKKYSLQHLAMYKELLNIYGTSEKYKNIILSNVYDAFIKLLEIDKKDGTTLVDVAFTHFPDFSGVIMRSQYGLLRSKDKELKKISDELEDRIQDYDALRNELDIIKNSKSWKTSQRLSKAGKLVGRKRKS